MTQKTTTLADKFESIKDEIILEEGDRCPECKGTMEIVVEGCSCHISPPCSACTDAPLVCNSCGNEQEAEPLYTPTAPKSAVVSLINHKSTKERFNELPDGSFGCIKYPSKNGWGMTVEGKMPEDMTREQVLKESGVCKYGCPHFYKFNGDIGVFLFTYNYD